MRNVHVYRTPEVTILLRMVEEVNNHGIGSADNVNRRNTSQTTRVWTK